MNIIDDNQYHGSLSSVLNFLNKCKYSGGKRLFKHQLTNPCFDENWLNNEYRKIDIFDKNKVDYLRTVLSSLPDMEKILRQMLIRKIYPFHIWQLYNSLNIIQTIFEKIYNPELPAGYAAIITIFAIFSGIQLIAIGMVGEYIGRMFLSQNKKPQYTIRSKLIK